VVFFLVAAAVFSFSGLAQADLIDRGGGLIYDTDLNITWLSDANYGGGTKSWEEAVAWAKNLKYFDSVRQVIWDGWRLPSAMNVNVDPPTGPDVGYISTSEMGHLFYIELGGTAGSPITSSTNPNLGLFTNIMLGGYWLGTEDPSNSAMAWFTRTYRGDQDWGNKGDPGWAWAVRDGDVGPGPEHPIANAGADQVVFSEVTLDASESHDPDGTIISYEWSLKHRGNPSNMRTAEGVNPTISGLQPGFYDVTLTVTDNDGVTGTDTMLLAVAGECAGWPAPNGDLSLNIFNITQIKKNKAATTLMSGKVTLPPLSLDKTVQGRITIELFGALAGGGDCVLSDELSLKVLDSKQLLVIGK
jgi:hypothetical protein